jgi:hypothetical protein
MLEEVESDMAPIVSLISLTPFGRQYRRLLDIVKLSGPDGVPRHKLTSRLHYLGMKSHEIGPILERLVTDGIFTVHVSNGARGGAVYKWKGD